MPTEDYDNPTPLRAMRAVWGMTQAQMAAALEIPLEAYQTLESDHEHSVSRLAETALKMQNETTQQKVLHDLTEIIAKTKVPKEPAE